MIVADTSIWIEFLKGKNDDVFSRMVSLLENNTILALEPIFGELLQGVKNKKEAQLISNYWENLPKIDELGLWIQAGLESSNNKYLSNGIGIIDSFIIIVAREAKSKVWSLDKKLNSILETEERFQI